MMRKGMAEAVLPFMIIASCTSQIHAQLVAAPLVKAPETLPAKIPLVAEATKAKARPPQPKVLKPYTKGYTATFSDGQVVGGGSCGYGQSDQTQTADDVYGNNTMSASTVLYKNGLACGACYRVKCTGSTNCMAGTQSPILTVTNICPPNGPGGWCDGQKKSYTLAPGVWNGIATDPNLAVAPVQVQQVQCLRVGGIRFKVIQGNSQFFSPWWAVLISNVGGSGDLHKVSVKLSGMYWQHMTHSYGAVWGLSQVQATMGVPGNFSFKLTSATIEETILIENAIPFTYLPNVEYKTNVNFNLQTGPAAAAGKKVLV